MADNVLIAQIRKNEGDAAADAAAKLYGDWKCVCAGQGGSVYSAECPIHDPTVDTANPSWRKWYDDHLEAQRRIKERLGW